MPRRQHLSPLSEHDRPDPLRRAALAVTVLVVPLLAVLLVLANRGGDPDDEPARVSGPAATARADLPVLEVPVPPVTAEADAACPALMTDLPIDLVGEQSRRVRSDTPYAYAWGDPPIVLRCGVERPAGFVRDSPLYALNGVSWFVDDSDPDRYVWTVVDRSVYVELTVPAEVDSGPAIALGPLITATLPPQEPRPGD